MLAGLAFTVPIAVISFSLGLIVGLLTALARISNIKPLVIIVKFYVWIIENTAFSTAFIIFYGLAKVNIILDPLRSNYRLYKECELSSEIIRATVLSIPKVNGKRLLQ